MTLTKQNTKQHVLRLVAIMLGLAVIFGIAATDIYADDSGVNAKPSVKQLRDKYNDAGTPPKGEATFSVAVNTGQYTPATLTPAAREYAEKYINFMRFQAGLGEITLDDALNANAAQGALIMARNGVFDHSQEIPEGISETAAKPGRYATMASNISYASSSPSPDYMAIIESAILGQMKDDSGSNLNSVGHRRWLLKPSTSTFGIGSALLVNRGGSNVAYSVVRVMNREYDELYDSSFGTVQANNSTNYDFVAWPASGNMLNEVFNTDTPWSLHIHENKYKPFDDDVSVEITRQSDGKKWTIDSSSPNILSNRRINSNYFKYSNNSNSGMMGEGHCLIFCPNPNELGSERLKGTFNVKVTGLKDKSTGSAKTIEYDVNFFDLRPRIEEMDITIDPESVEYTGSELKPGATVVYDGAALVQGTDYTISYKNNIGVGTATATIKGKGKYEGSKDLTFAITPKKITVPSPKSGLTYTGSSQQGVDGTSDYNVSGGSATNAGNYTATVTLKDKINTTWSDGSTADKSVPWSIAPKTLVGSMVTVSPSEKEYNRENQKPTVTVKDGNSSLVSGKDYTLDNMGGTDVGEYTVTVTGKGNYTDSVNKTFKINAKSINADMISFDKDTFEYNGQIQKPVVIVKDGNHLIQDADYTLTNEGGKEIGQYSVSVTGKGNYTGTAEKTFRITYPPLDGNVEIVVSQDNVYTGKAITPDVTVTLKDSGKELTKDTDYTVSYSNNINVGTAKVTIKGIGAYTGSQTAEFTISPRKITPAVALSANSYAYNGEAKTPTVTVKDGDKVLTNNTDYSVSYAEGRTAVGTYKVTVTLKGNYNGSQTAEFTISPRKITPAVALSANSYVYNGKVKTPGVTVKDGSKVLKKDTDYTVTYAAGRTKVGKYNVKVTLKGNYSGVATKTFAINKARNTMVVKVKKPTVAYKKVKKKNQAIAVKNAFAVSKAVGKVTYKKKSGNNRIIIASTGKITVKKGIKKGTYKVKVTVKAAGNANYNALSKVVTIAIRVK